MILEVFLVLYEGRSSMKVTTFPVRKEKSSMM
jgi:hypothetical protein